MSNKTKIFILAIVTITGALYFLAPHFFKESKNIIAAPKPQNLASDLLPVDVVVIKTQELSNKIYTTGSLLASEETALYSESNGKVTQISFNEGQAVAKGTLLIKLNDRDLIAQLDRIKIEKKFAQTTLDRQKQLFEKGGISREQFDQAQNTVNILNAQLDEVTAKIEKTEVRAPFDGIIGLRQISAGAYLTPSVLAATIQNLTVLNVEFSLPEKYFKNANVGDIVQFRVSGVDSLFSAQIYAIEPQIDINTRTVVMRARFDNKTAKLLPGLFAYIEYNLEKIENAILIPTQAVVPELKGQKVYILKDGIVDEKSIETGIRTDTEIQVLQGVQFGDSVITTGILQIRKGMNVQARNVN